MTKLITRKEYLENSTELFDKYYMQFASTSTKAFVLSGVTVRQLLESEDKHLNDVKIPFNNMGSGGSWWWDLTPINLEVAREAGEVSARGTGSPSTHTCVGKAMARAIIEERRK